MAETQKIKKKKSPLTYAFRRFIAVCLLLVLFWYYSNYTLTTTRTSITSPKLSSTVTVTIISDLHINGFGMSPSKVLRRVKRADSDIVVVLGDMCSRGTDDSDKTRTVTFMADLVSQGKPVYFVSGDHDYGKKYLANIAKVGVHVMNYESEIIELNGNRIRIMGIDNVYYSDTFDLHNAFTLDASCYNILLAHIPNYPKFADFGADLTLCADTHGNMVRLPFGMGPVYDFNTQTLLPYILDDADCYDKGWYGYNEGSMFITSGLGDSPVPVRLFNRPEVVVMTLEPQ